MDINHEVVHGLAVGRGEFRQAQDIVGEPIFHTSVGFWESFASRLVLAEDVDEETRRKHVNTVSTTPSRVRMPKFMPSAMGESMLLP